MHGCRSPAPTPPGPSIASLGARTRGGTRTVQRPRYRSRLISTEMKPSGVRISAGLAATVAATPGDRGSGTDPEGYAATEYERPSAVAATSNHVTAAVCSHAVYRHTYSTEVGVPSRSASSTVASSPSSRNTGLTSIHGHGTTPRRPAWLPSRTGRRGSGPPEPRSRFIVSESGADESGAFHCGQIGRVAFVAGPPSAVATLVLPKVASRYETECQSPRR